MKNSKQKKRASQYQKKTKKVNRGKYFSKHINKQREKTPSFEKLVKVISSINKSVHFLIATFAVGIGFMFNAIDEMPLFWLKAPFGFVIYLMLSYTIMYIENKNKQLTIELTGDPYLAKCREEYTKKTNSNFNFILCFLACIYFVSISIILEFVKINPIGIYSLCALSYVVFCAFIVFQQYIFILFLLYDISKITPGKYYELIPERTEWFNLLERYSNISRNIFVVLGSLFILLFTIFSPINSIQIIFREKFASPQFIPLLCTWIIILIAIVFMIPFSSFIKNIFLKRIYQNLVTQSINNYNQMYKKCKNENKIFYMDIILRLYDRKYVLQDSYTWFIPVIVSITNFASIIISTILDLKDLGLLT